MRLWLGIGLVCVGVTLACGQSANGVRKEPAAQTELDQIAVRGRALAAYDQAVWHGTDAVQAMHPADGEVEMYLARPSDRGWVAGFGHLNTAGDAFLLTYEVYATDAKQPLVQHHAPAFVDRTVWLEQARAFATVKALPRDLQRPYNLAVLPTEGGKWFVYAYPAQTENGVYPTGADTRYLLSADGTKVEATHLMHHSLLTFEAPKDAKTQETFRTAVIDDAPEDSDVATVLMMGGVPSLVACKTFVYKIAADGTPTYLMSTKQLMKESKSAK